MMDIEKMIDSRMNEISNFITEMQKEREDHLHRTAQIDQQCADAEKDYDRCRRAMKALRGEDEPKPMTSNKEATLAELEFGVPQPPYHPGRDR
jgi:chromosome segregation ATPase